MADDTFYAVWNKDTDALVATFSGKDKKEQKEAAVAHRDRLSAVNPSEDTVQAVEVKVL